ncbi:hypothetical protein [Terriglobus saanensis]|uniref:Uncharacterized protein n=1 Tax=Terriglobus saanensis (strain ATCC BAA-1853 / DSM 23119 / SP1PR4) TaxID=401053 RepID=E8V4J2_TERSS|nr:hypothetical protein [Terriglobus saanensis]ADV84816.1 conserved hypothetical protein; putative exported protein [Terriglobus saanensis SP1PR4]
MQLKYRVLLSFLVIVLGYKLMITAFRWMNLASDAALYGGIVVLVVTVVGVLTAVRSLWRRT